MKSAICARCNEEKEIRAKGYCCVCYRQQYYKKNNARVKEVIKAYYQQNKEEIKKRNRVLYYINKDRYVQVSRYWRSKNKEYLKEKGRIKYLKNRDSILAKNRLTRRLYPARYKLYHKKAQQRMLERYKTDPNYKLRRLLSGYIRRSILKGSNKTIALLGADIDTVRKYIESKFKHGMCWDNHGPFGWHLDHIKPLASFDLTKEDEQRRCFHYKNLQPMWWRLNLLKGAKNEDCRV